jgi:hypothetical protein
MQHHSWSCFPNAVCAYIQMQKAIRANLRGPRLHRPPLSGSTRDAASILQSPKVLIETPDSHVSLPFWSTATIYWQPKENYDAVDKRKRAVAGEMTTARSLDRNPCERALNIAQG